MVNTLSAYCVVQQCCASMRGSRKFCQGGSHFDNFFFIKLLASSERVHKNCELPDEIYNICECL